MFESDSSVDIPYEAGRMIRMTKLVKFRTGNTFFVACGAFSGIKDIAKQQTAGIGFDTKDSKPSQNDTLDALAKYGLFEELMGRFGSILNFDPLSAEDLIEILERNTIRQYRNEFQLSGINLKINRNVKENIVNRALESGLGARSLSSNLVAALRDASFEAYSSPRTNCINLYMEDDSIRFDLGFSKKQKSKISIFEEMPEMRLGEVA
jgi:ATP-dependent protease Clp ATPase subunit